MNIKAVVYNLAIKRNKALTDSIYECILKTFCRLEADSNKIM